MAIRPERVRLSQVEPSKNGLRVVVREAVYRGAYQEAWLDPSRAANPHPGDRRDSRDLRIRTAPHPTLEPGQELWAELPLESLVVLDE